MSWALHLSPSELLRRKLQGSLRPHRRQRAEEADDSPNMPVRGQFAKVHSLRPVGPEQYPCKPQRLMMDLWSAAPQVTARILTRAQNRACGLRASFEGPATTSQCSTILQLCSLKTSAMA